MRAQLERGLRGYRASGSAPAVPWASALSEPGTCAPRCSRPAAVSGVRSLQVCSGHGAGKASWCGKPLGPGPQGPWLRARPGGRRGSRGASRAESGSLALRIAGLRWLCHIRRDFYFVTVRRVRLAGKVAPAPPEPRSVEGGDASEAPFTSGGTEALIDARGS